MNHSIKAIVLLWLLTSSCTHTSHPPIRVDEVSPWCILGFDALDRTPEQRIAMLKEMGFTKYGYNKGKGDFSAMPKEFALASENNLEIVSVFLWLNADRDSLGKLSPSNQILLNGLKQVEQKPTLWLSFSDNYFEDLSQEESIAFSIDMIRFVQSEADQLSCDLALYNHHGWFGNPHNLVEILERLDDDKITMVYNFHHAQEYVDEFPEIAKRIAPYLSFVNLNGVKKEGPQIVPIGQGDHEFDMMEQLMREGFAGPWGILGHIKTEDVQKVLAQNLEGLEEWNAR
ncbi:MAG: TIM barrel protein [Bacteroidota bacterium]